MSLTLRNGKVLFRVGYGGETRLEMASQDRHNTGNWTIVEASRLFDRRKKLEKGVLVNDYLVAKNYFVVSNFFVRYHSLVNTIFPSLILHILAETTFLLLILSHRHTEGRRRGSRWCPHISSWSGSFA